MSYPGRFRLLRAVLLGGGITLALLLAMHASVPAVASSPPLKIAINATGLYRLGYEDLQAAGFSFEHLDPRRLSLWNHDMEVALFVDGEADGVFDPSDSILFYAEGLDTVYTDTNVYWLQVGDKAGLRMQVRTVTPTAGGPTPAFFPATVHAEVNNYYWQTLPNGAGLDHWFWGDKLTGPATATVVISVPAVASVAEPVALRVRLQGHTTSATTPNHHSTIALNGVPVDDRLWSGETAFVHRVSPDPSLLHTGANTVTVRAVGDLLQGDKPLTDQFFLYWVEIDYARRYQARDDSLTFTPASTGTFAFQVDGFSGGAVQVYDITDPVHPVRLEGGMVEASPAGHRLRFRDAATPASRYLALTTDRVRTPLRVQPDRPSSWKSPAHGADYIVITHRDFLSATLPLVDFHRRQGLRVAVVDVEDLYDEFNAGVFDPQAIRDFLSYAYHTWQAPPPTYVLLVGDANQDYRDYLGTGTPNTLPTQIVQTAILGETPSDNWYVAVDGTDPLPDMHIGRLSVQSAAEATTVVAKILGYAQVGQNSLWRRRGVLVADDDSATFVVTSEKLAALASKRISVRRIYAGSYPPGDPVADLTAAWDAGALFVNYTGHGSVSRWGNWKGNGAALLDAGHIQALTNGARLPIVTMANCLSGFFPGPAPQISVAERLLRQPNGGAVAVWAPTGLNYPAGHEELLKAFYGQLLQDPPPTLGVAVDRAKAAVYAQSPFWGELVDMFVLFGDPAMQIVIPPPPPVYLPLVTGE